jgi:hypothetical protein
MEIECKARGNPVLSELSQKFDGVLKRCREENVLRQRRFHGASIAASARERSMRNVNEERPAKG